ncbi:MAG: glycosyltransferase family 2 protein [Vulcanimicrobiota bacterium]
MSSVPTLCVIVPIYNEASGLPALLEQLDIHLKDLDYQCLVVDDGSTDGTWAALTELQEKYPLRALRLSRNFGKEAALCAGLEFAEGEAFVTIDGDLQHPPELIPEMVRTWQEQACDLVEGIKMRSPNEGYFSRTRARLFYKVFNLMCGTDLEGQTDFKLLSARARDAWLRLPERNMFFRGVTNWLGFDRARVQFMVRDIPGRDSRWSFFGLMRYAINNITAFSSIPLTMLLVTGLLLLFPASLVGGWTLYLKFTGQAVNGLSTINFLILSSGGLNFLGLSILGLYVGRIHEEVKARPRYVLRDQL